ncbi:hypothetical protein BH24PSE2_BH24PSE2_13140 [soil metagenome]
MGGLQPARPRKLAIALQGGLQPAACGGPDIRTPAAGAPDHSDVKKGKRHVLKFLGKTVFVIFLIGLLVVVGLLVLIF